MQIIFLDFYLNYLELFLMKCSIQMHRLETPPPLWALPDHRKKKRKLYGIFLGDLEAAVPLPLNPVK